MTLHSRWDPPPLFLSMLMIGPCGQGAGSLLFLSLLVLYHLMDADSLYEH